MEQSMQHISVLYVEDDAFVRDIITKMLQNRVKAVHMARDGEEGLEVFLRERPDIVITDLEMPRMGGVELMNRIRMEDPSVPVIVITAFRDQVHLAADADLVLVKPVYKDALLKGILDSLKR